MSIFCFTVSVCFGLLILSIILLSLYTSKYYDRALNRAEKVPLVSGSKNSYTIKLDGPICHDRWYNVSGREYLDIVPRRAYYDNRIVYGKNRNLVTVLTEMLHSADVEESVLHCELNGFYSAEVTVTMEDTWWVRTHKPGHTHYNTVIQCPGFPKQAIRQGSTVSLIYRAKNESCYSRVATEKPLFLMNTPMQPTQGKGSVVVCSALFGLPPYLNEWLRYQKAIGVDRVHFNVEASFAENATKIYPYLREALRTGFASMEVWRNYVGERMYYYAQILKYQDCVMRFAGVYEYAFLCDSDDFFNPMIPGKDVHFHLSKLFTSTQLSSVRLRWKRFECKPVESVYKHLLDRNITKSLGVNTTSSWTTNYKSIYRLVSTGLVAVHDEYKIFPGHHFVTANASVAYMAHIRPGRKC